MTHKIEAVAQVKDNIIAVINKIITQRGKESGIYVLRTVTIKNIKEGEHATFYFALNRLMAEYPNLIKFSGHGKLVIKHELFVIITKERIASGLPANSSSSG
jgi:hypothetical protein